MSEDRMQAGRPASRSAAVVGGGPAGLMAAEVLSAAGLPVTIFDRMPTPGRKFLMAGRGGLNLTHSEPLPDFLSRYGPDAERLRDAVESFPPAALRSWAEGLAQRTFVGSSGRVFPQSLKASPLLRAWLARLAGLGVELALRHDWQGWDAGGRLIFRRPDGGTRTVAADAVVLALGGASWPKLGADGSWTGILAARGINVAPLRPANCGFTAEWTTLFRRRFAGEPLKNLAVTYAGRSARGDLVVTSSGLEGGALYALSAPLRDAIDRDGRAEIALDLRPDIPAPRLAGRLAATRPGESLANRLRKALRLPPVATGLLREAAGPDLPRAPDRLAALIKAVPVRLVGAEPLARAISTAGGIAWEELDGNFMLRAMPGVFAAGEMLDWEAPTGGYLLQGCFASGRSAALGALAYLDAAAGSRRAAGA